MEIVTIKNILFSSNTVSKSILGNYPWVVHTNYIQYSSYYNEKYCILYIPPPPPSRCQLTIHSAISWFNKRPLSLVAGARTARMGWLVGVFLLERRFVSMCVQKNGENHDAPTTYHRTSISGSGLPKNLSMSAVKGMRMRVLQPHIQRRKSIQVPICSHMPRLSPVHIAPKH